MKSRFQTHRMAQLDQRSDLRHVNFSPASQTTQHHSIRFGGRYDFYLSAYLRNFITGVAKISAPRSYHHHKSGTLKSQSSRFNTFSGRGQTIEVHRSAKLDGIRSAQECGLRK
jgi:hypothetical protein